MTISIASEEASRVQRIAKTAAISAAAIAPLIAVPLAFAAVDRAMKLLGFAGQLPALPWRLAIAGLAALWAVVWTARHAPEMVRVGLRGHGAGEGGR